MPASSRDVRIETDSLGEIEVPAWALWGAQTQRSLKFFGIGEERMPVAIIHAFGLLKASCARVNGGLGKLERQLVDLIVAASEEVAEGKLDRHFPLRIWQTGSGTQTNMNVNEVVANRANELAGRERGSKSPVHPNDHVNRSQSSNDAFPTAMHVAAAREVAGRLIPSIKRIRAALEGKRSEFAGVVKIGRTHLQDATPITFGQEFSGYVALLDRNQVRIEQALDGLYDLAIGGTAVGTGLNAPPEFGERVAGEMGSLTGLPFRTHPNKFAALSAHDEIVAMSAALATLAGALMKIANDIRWLGSGPRAGLGELILPANEPGSSIMPGKVNPTQSEALAMVAVQVMGNHATVGFAGSQGNFELNVFKPVMIANLLQSSTLLSDAMESFADHCVAGLRVNAETVRRHLESSLMLVTALAPHLGYDQCAAIAKNAHETNRSLREAAIGFGVAGEMFDRWVNPEKMTGPDGA